MGPHCDLWNSFLSDLGNSHNRYVQAADENLLGTNEHHILQPRAVPPF